MKEFLKCKPARLVELLVESVLADSEAGTGELAMGRIEKSAGGAP